ncbi:DNA topoisomerase 1, partial [Dissostichus eleginoides]
QLPWRVSRHFLTQQCDTVNVTLPSSPVTQRPSVICPVNQSEGQRKLTLLLVFISFHLSPPFLHCSLIFIPPLAIPRPPVQP